MLTSALQDVILSLLELATRRQTRAPVTALLQHSVLVAGMEGIGLRRSTCMSAIDQVALLIMVNDLAIPTESHAIATNLGWYDRIFGHVPYCTIAKPLKKHLLLRRFLGGILIRFYCVSALMWQCCPLPSPGTDHLGHLSRSSC